jgi:asparagine synthase (glutamine-hydrolysing)
MAASVEVRVPFVDKVVAEAAFTLVGRDKIRGKTQKAALKDAAESWLPHEIVYRPKASFGAPLRAWVRNDLRDMIGDVLLGGELVQAGMLRKQVLLRLIADEQAGRQDYAKQIWQLLSMELWYRQVRATGVSM